MEYGILRLFLTLFQPVVVQQVVGQSDDMAGGVQDVGSELTYQPGIFFMLHQLRKLADRTERRPQVMAHRQHQIPAGHQQFFIPGAGGLKCHPALLPLSDVGMDKKIEQDYQKNGNDSYGEDDTERLPSQCRRFFHVGRILHVGCPFEIMYQAADTCVQFPVAAPQAVRAGLQSFPVVSILAVHVLLQPDELSVHGGLSFPVPHLLLLPVGISGLLVPASYKNIEKAPAFLCRWCIRLSGIPHLPHDSGSLSQKKAVRTGKTGKGVRQLMQQPLLFLQKHGYGIYGRMLFYCIIRFKSVQGV